MKASASRLDLSRCCALLPAGLYLQVGRGGGPMLLAIQSQPPGSVQGSLRITEQVGGQRGRGAALSWLCEEGQSGAVGRSALPIRGVAAALDPSPRACPGGHTNTGCPASALPAPRLPTLAAPLTSPSPSSSSRALRPACLQGEMVQAKFGIPEMARRQMEIFSEVRAPALTKGSTNLV